MLNLKLSELIENYYNIVPAGLVFGFIFIYQLLFLLRFEFEFFDHLDNNSVFFLCDFTNLSTIKTNFYNLNYTFTNIKSIGFVIFSNYSYHFVIGGFVLLLAMLAAIVLTLHKNFISKNQNIYKQILADYNTALKFQ
jgi:NADH:ubiquinone oxidoreductase subunit 6 (subunit J)